MKNCGRLYSTVYDYKLKQIDKILEEILLRADVVMSVDGKILVINGENDSATEEIYHTISEKMSRELE